MVNNILGFTQPISKLVELNTQHFDTLMNTQKQAVDDYRSLVQQRMQSASDIKDPVALAQFVTEQMVMAQSNYESMVNNSRALFEAMTGYNAEVIQLFQESTQQLKQQIQQETEQKP
ncbi:MAG: phasin family protein [Cycloclasticus sp.]|nr:phasin family protein [Cycloclasticus sp.]MBQ0790873.1 phasin family protein [Cycloclasticus sp.]